VSDAARVVVGVDGSASSRAALGFALADAGRRDAEIQVVRVVHAPEHWPVGLGMASSSAGTPAIEQILSEVEQETHSIVAEVVAEVGASAARIPVRVQALSGTPAGVLIEQAHGADLLVVGHRGRGGFANALLGSVGMHCVLHATCPVTVVRPASQRTHEADR
jgi:nucleotide-binding universal stress UspA family protein